MQDNPVLQSAGKRRLSSRVSSMVIRLIIVVGQMVTPQPDDDQIEKRTGVYGGLYYLLIVKVYIEID